MVGYILGEHTRRLCRSSTRAHTLSTVPTPTTPSPLVVGKKGRTTLQEIDKREKNIKELTGKKAAGDTQKAVQATIDAASNKKASKAAAQMKCGYCQQPGHKYTRNGITLCPLAIADERKAKDHNA